MNFCDSTKLYECHKNHNVLNKKNESQQTFKILLYMSDAINP